MNLPAEQTVSKKTIGFASRYRRKGIATPDMTPMVDLGFLLIAFFVFTAELTKPSSLNLTMPKNGPPIKLGETNALTILLGDKNMYYYFGKMEDAINGKRILSTTFSEQHGIGKIIRERQAMLIHKYANLRSKDLLMLIIKPMPQSSYNSLIKALDEALINAVKSYVVVAAEEIESREFERLSGEKTTF